MSGPASDESVDVLQVLIGRLANLSDDERMRILRTVATYYGLGLDARHPNTRPVSSNDTNAPSRPFSFSEDREMSPKEFIIAKQPRTDVERVACLAYYLTHYRGTPHFKTFDISKLNTEAAQAKFANAAWAVNNAVKTRYLAQASRGARQLSTLGEQFVQALPDRDAARNVLTMRPKRRRSGATRAKAFPQ